jgi:hypothetical protein
MDLFGRLEQSDAGAKLRAKLASKGMGATPPQSVHQMLLAVQEMMSMQVPKLASQRMAELSVISNKARCSVPILLHKLCNVLDTKPQPVLARVRYLRGAEVDLRAQMVVFPLCISA